jgi:hypothetical protein
MVAMVVTIVRIPLVDFMFLFGWFNRAFHSRHATTLLRTAAGTPPAHWQ